MPHPPAPAGTIELLDATLFTLTTALEHAHTRAEALLHQLTTDGLTPAVVVDAHALRGVIELLSEEAEGLSSLLSEALPPHD